MDRPCDNLAPEHQEPARPRHYPAELRRQTCERMLAGERSRTSQPSSAWRSPFCKGRRQALIGRRPGAKSCEADPLRAARQRSRELEAELKVVKAASAFVEGAADGFPGSSSLTDREAAA